MRSMKYLAGLILLTVVTAAFAGTPDKELHTKCIYPSVYVWTDSSRGSGVIVSSRLAGDSYINTVFTAAHVLVGNNLRVHAVRYKNWSAPNGFDTYAARIVRRDEDKDVAVITFTSPFKQAVADVDWQPQLYLGNKIVKVGTGQSLLPRVDYGCISCVEERIIAVGTPVVRASVYNTSGDSGGPVYCDYKLIGVVHGLHTETFHGVTIPCTNITYFVPVGNNFSEKDIQ